MTKNIKELAPKVLEYINNSKSILLHCHPSPDPDSVGSVLAMKFALESINKKVTVIKGDSDLPEAFGHFPGFNDILKKNYFEIDKQDFDLFLILDSGSINMVSMKNEVRFENIKTVVIDHHFSNKGFGDFSLIDSSYTSTAEMLFDIFKCWNIDINHDIAVNLFVGMYTDTGGFKYEAVTINTYEIATNLVRIAPDFHKYIFKMENSNLPEDIRFQGLALSSISNYLNDNIAISAIPFVKLKENNLIDINQKISLHSISNMLKSVIGWNIGISMIELEPDVVKISFRTRDSDVFDVSKIAVALGGGGHKAASGATLKMSCEQAIKKVVETAKIIYNL